MSSSFLATKSKKLRPIAVVVESRRSFEQYMIVQFTVKRSRMRAVRYDCDGNGSKVIVREDSRSWSESVGDDGDSGLRALFLRIGLGGIGEGSFHR